MATYRKTRIVRCDQCGEVFWTNHQTAQYCSNKCRQLAYRKRQEQRKEAERQQAKMWPTWETVSADKRV